MRHDEPSIIAFLEGELSATEAAAFDVHLVGCDACWTAVQEDRQGRLLVDSLRDTAPSPLRDRVRMAVGMAQPKSASRRRRWLALPAAALVAVTLLVAPAVVGGHGPRDPEAVAAVVRLARTGVSGPPTAMVAGGQRITVAHYRLGDHRVVVAQSVTHFPMPAGSEPLSRGQESPWATSRDDLHLLCYAGDHPALLAGDVSVPELQAMARSLGIS